MMALHESPKERAEAAEEAFVMAKPTISAWKERRLPLDIDL
jgi:hypothetical protein